jgi:hypothetical protein
MLLDYELDNNSCKGCGEKPARTWINKYRQR